MTVTVASLENARAKLAQAKHHLKNLKLSYKRPRPLKKPSDKVWVHYDPKTGTLQVETYIAQPPRRWTLLLGDVIHNLRSCLDHVAHSLAVQNGAKPREAKRTQFPIYESEHQYRINCAYKIEGVLHPSAVAAMLRLQPYCTPQDPRAPMLWILSQLDNTDKHRHLLVIHQHVVYVGQIDWPGLSLRFESRMRAQVAANERTKLFKAPFPPMGPPSGFKVENITRRIAFAETNVCDGYYVIPTLSRLIETVESILRDFNRSFFSKRSRHNPPLPL